VTFSDCVVVRESGSGKALLIYIDDLGEDKWIPKSVIDDDSEVWADHADGCGPGKLVIKEWFATKEQMI